MNLYYFININQLQNNNFNSDIHFYNNVENLLPQSDIMIANAIVQELSVAYAIYDNLQDDFSFQYGQ